MHIAQHSSVIANKQESNMKSSGSSSSNPNINLFAILLMYSSLSTSYVALAQNTPQDILLVHNEARAEVGVGPLRWDETLMAYGRSYADKRVDDCELEHSGGPYGENLAENYDNMDFTDAVKYWVSEKSHYDHDSNKCVKDECLHYTQVVWRDTTHVGCARAKCKNGWMFVICNYSPPGNVEGQKPY